MVKRREILQDWLTLMGMNGDQLVQNQAFNMNVSGAGKVVVRWQVMKASNVSLYLQTSKVLEKKHWRDTKTLTSSGSVVLTREAGLTSEFLEDFLRWRVSGTADNWQLTFRIRAYVR
jgi:hypothetical protein